MIRSVPQLQLSLVWADDDLHEFVVYASSEYFSGATSVYVAPGDMSKLASRLSGFPSSREDQREFVLGQTDLAGYGEVQGLLYCRDSTGHVGLHIAMRCGASKSGDRPESCAVLLHVVPSDLDRFVEELLALAAVGGVATLKNAA